jgi:hypothetical protein
VIGRPGAEVRFEDLVTVFSTRPGVTVPDEGRGFGSGALRANGRIFAMVVRGRLVVKLPRDRVDALVEQGQGVRFDANKGRPMAEWVSLDPASTVDWEALAAEALAFVSS